MQAGWDAFTPAPTAPEEDTVAARQWLTSDAHEADRRHVCELAGLDPDAVREAARQRDPYAHLSWGAYFFLFGHPAEGGVRQ